MKSSMWSTSEFAEVVSHLTGRTLYVNTGNKLVIPPTFTIDKMRQALSDYPAYLVQKYKHPDKRSFPKHLKSSLQEMTEAEDLHSFSAALERFVSSMPAAQKDLDTSARKGDLLVRLWQKDCLILPISYPPELNFKLARSWGFDTTINQFVSDFLALQTESTGVNDLKWLLALILSVSGVRGAGDLIPDTVKPFFSETGNKSRVRIAKGLLKLQLRDHGSLVTHQAVNYLKIGRVAVRGDDNFAWAVDADPTLKEWASIGAEFMAGVQAGVCEYRVSINGLLNLLVEHPEIFRRPVDFFRHDAELPEAFQQKDSKYNNYLYRFCEWVLDHRFVTEDDFGVPVRLPGFKNPYSFKKKKPTKFETHRNPMPTRFVRMLIELLTENDFAWPKVSGVPLKHGKGGDYIKWLDPETGVVEEIWSPVRAIAILAKLLLPSRTFQVRMLDSGEGDSEVYRPERGGWVPNPRETASNIAKGVFCRYRGTNGEESIFLRFNTNKTADVDDLDGDNGYIMPWQNAEAIRIFAYLRDWQEKFNPQGVPTRWVDIKEQDISTRFTKERLERRGSAFFLFRDACSPYRDQPVTDSRLITFWRNLNAELERRLAEAGETAPGGTPIQLVKRQANGAPGPAIFDLHTLRVTIITALAESGGVPIDVLMKVVGHATVIMTMYYVKLSPAHISKTLNEAELAIRNDEQRNWQGWLAHQSHDVLLKAVAYTSPTAVKSITEVAPTSWVVRDHGICPVGCSRCHEGGPAVYESDVHKKYHPVPGGADGCVRCRFFITGPAFLLGMQSYFDSVGWQLREASGRYQLAKERFEELSAEYGAARSSGEPITRELVHRYDVASSNLDQATLAVDDLAHLWHATYRLVEQCLNILRQEESTSGGDYALIAVGGQGNLELALEDCTEFDLIDRVCQSAVFFEGIDATTPNLKRMRAFDAMLRRNGCQPIFLDLDERDALKAGNQLAAFLYNRFGREQTNALVAGKETLQRLGIEQREILDIASKGLPASFRLTLEADKAVPHQFLLSEGDKIAGDAA